ALCRGWCCSSATSARSHGEGGKPTPAEDGEPEIARVATMMMNANLGVGVMAASLRLNGSRRAHRRSLHAHHTLVDFYHKTPDRITEEDLQHYFLHRRNMDPSKTRRLN
ncbi:MAG: hypothetical protein ACREX9_06900, partial [Gammaproteobacteria bacterium]